MVRGSLEDVASFLQSAQDVVIVSHINPDGDAIGSMAAMGHIVRAMGKQVAFVHETGVPQRFSFLLDAPCAVYDDTMGPRSHVVCVDCASLERIGAVQRMCRGAVLNIDHHATNVGYGSHNYVVPHAASTTHVLMDVLRHLRVPLTQPLASCVYAGLLTDTGGFRFRSATADVFAVAHELVCAGADAHALAFRLLEQKTMQHVHVLARALQTLSFAQENKVAWVVLDRDALAGAGEDDIEGIVHIPTMIAGVHVGVLFKQKGDHEVKVSLRAQADVNVARIAEQFGGGGHILAAGCTVHDTLEHAIQRVIAAVCCAV
ncbi:MAG: bifunctional oligoribonuclease/PAP phosphatase NrnA [Paenibacillaceae bacterium]|nr:bifunctional oligoribonuclease/PAP phosphatase NrnA [Paenibacillaceae bacterium]